jgi:hypothetical protein
LVAFFNIYQVLRVNTKNSTLITIDNNVSTIVHYTDVCIQHSSLTQLLFVTVLKG